MQETLDAFEIEQETQVVRNTVKCPCCGYDVPCRAKLGQGTQRGKDMKMNENRQHILDCLAIANRPLDVREVQKMLVNRHIRRISRRGAGWNYHTVQADLSILIAMKKVEMVKPHELEEWNPIEGHTTRNVPHYRLCSDL